MLTLILLKAGFKPFASKQVTILSNDGKLTCKYGNSRENTSVLSDEHKFLIDIVEEIIDKVDEIINCSINEIREHEFEVIAYPNETFNNVDRRDCLDTIEENVTDATMSIEMIGDDEIQVINSGLDSDGLNDKFVKSNTVINKNDDNQESNICAETRYM